MAFLVINYFHEALEILKIHVMIWYKKIDKKKTRNSIVSMFINFECRNIMVFYVSKLKEKNDKNAL